MMEPRAQEGDFLETFEGLIFDVKGLVHPPNKIIAFPRYFPSETGKREKDGRFYCKVYSILERYQLLQTNFHQYLVFDPVFDDTLCEVPVEAVEKHYQPVKRLRELRNADRLDELESLAVHLAEMLKENANVPWSSLGVSGSIMVGLHTPESDIDLIVYGSKNCQKVYCALKEMLKNETSILKPYNQRYLERLFDFRSKDTYMSFEDFVRTESRKVLQGKFLSSDYFLRFVKNWNEVNVKYGDIRYKKIGYATIKARIADDSEAIFTPCKYEISHVETLEGVHVKPLLEIASFRGRFCEQARKGEIVIARGKIERVTMQEREYYQILLGGTVDSFMKLC